MWMSKTWASGPKQKVLEKLEEEFLADPTNKLLAAHILQLKKAWGLACELPRDFAQAVA